MQDVAFILNTNLSHVTSKMMSCGHSMITQTVLESFNCEENVNTTNRIVG